MFDRIAVPEKFIKDFIEFVDRSGAIEVPAKTTRIMNGMAVFRVLLMFVGVVSSCCYLRGVDYFFLNVL